MIFSVDISKSSKNSNALETFEILSIITRMHWTWLETWVTSELWLRERALLLLRYWLLKWWNQSIDYLPVECRDQFWKQRLLNKSLATCGSRAFRRRPHIQEQLPKHMKNATCPMRNTLKYSLKYSNFFSVYMTVFVTIYLWMYWHFCLPD